MNYLETLKNISKDKKAKKENLIFILVLLVILLISINYIFNNDTKLEEPDLNAKTSQNVDKNNKIEDRIAEVLAQIAGVSEVSIIINYKDQGKSSIVYDTKETLNENGNQASIEKNVAYNEKGGEKTAIIQMTTSPEVEGVIIVAKGVQGAEIKQKLAQSLGTLLGIPSYKVQVFER